MRLFVALDIDDEIRNKISRFVDEMREFAPEARWVRPESLHVTLKFIGEKFEQEVEKIKLALGTMESKQLSCHSDPRAKRGTEESLPFFSSKIEMSICGYGFFPNVRAPRVFWIGIDATPNLAEIAAQVEARLEPLGVAREPREFKPHLTLARISESRGIENLCDALRQCGTVDFGAVRANEMYLYRSELGRGGAKYSRLKTFAFAKVP